MADIIVDVNMKRANHNALYHAVLLCSSKNVDWLSFFTQRVLDDLVSHLRIFRKALKTCREEHGMIQCVVLSCKRFVLHCRVSQGERDAGKHFLHRREKD